MIFERIDLNLDIARLREHLESNVLSRPPVMQNECIGGWTVLSSNGDYHDGWVRGHTCFVETDEKHNYDELRARELGVKPTGSYKIPTEICTGYMNEVVTRIQRLGLGPRRARIFLLKAGGASSYHRDGFPNEYCVRLHVPIHTNPLCTFECEEGHAHFPADGSAYFISVNRLHRVVNRGGTDRLHLVMDVLDTRGVSHFHRFSYPPGKDAKA